MQYSFDNLATMLPEPISAAFISHAHNQGADNLVGPLKDLVYKTKTTQPGIALTFIAQNPNRLPDETDQAGKVAEIVKWASSTYPVIDVFGAFNATGDPNPLLEDAQHTSEAGSQLWADVVTTWITVEQR